MTMQKPNIPIMVGNLDSWAKIVKRRDNYRCVICGEQSIYLQAHHILSRWQCHKMGCSELPFLVANGETLCAKHHEKIGGIANTQWDTIIDRAFYGLLGESEKILIERQDLDKWLLKNNLRGKEPYFSLLSQFNELLWDEERHLSYLEMEIWDYCQPSILAYLAPFRNRDWIDIRTPEAFKGICNNIKKTVRYAIKDLTATQKLQEMDGYKRFEGISSTQRGLLSQINSELKKGV